MATQFSIFVVNAGLTVTISGLSITNGNPGGGNDGGGIQNSGTLTVNACTFSQNTGTTGGGIANLSGASLTLMNSNLSSNSNFCLRGTGLANFGTATVTGCTFNSNYAIDEGGAIYDSGTQLTISNSTLTDNGVNTTAAATAGGAAFPQRRHSAPQR